MAELTPIERLRAIAQSGTPTPPAPVVAPPGGGMIPSPANSLPAPTTVYQGLPAARTVNPVTRQPMSGASKTSQIPGLTPIQRLKIVATNPFPETTVRTAAPPPAKAEPWYSGIVKAITVPFNVQKDATPLPPWVKNTEGGIGGLANALRAGEPAAPPTPSGGELTLPAGGHAPIVVAKQKLDALATDIVTLNAQITTSPISDKSSQKELDAQNEKIQTYNDKLTQYKADRIAYNTEYKKYTSSSPGPSLSTLQLFPQALVDALATSTSTKTLPQIKDMFTGFFGIQGWGDLIKSLGSISPDEFAQMKQLVPDDWAGVGKDALKGLAGGLLSIPVRLFQSMSEDVYGKAAAEHPNFFPPGIANGTINLPVVGEVKTYQQQIDDEKKRGVSAPIAIAKTTVEAVFDALFVAGIVSKLTTPKPVVLLEGEVAPPQQINANILPADKQSIWTRDLFPGNKTTIRKLNPETEAVFKDALEEASRLLSKGEIHTTRISLTKFGRIDIPMDEFYKLFDPNKPLYLQTTVTPNGTIRGALVQFPGNLPTDWVASKTPKTSDASGQPIIVDMGEMGPADIIRTIKTSPVETDITRSQPTVPTITPGGTPAATPVTNPATGVPPVSIPSGTAFPGGVSPVTTFPPEVLPLIESAKIPDNPQNPQPGDIVITTPPGGGTGSIVPGTPAVPGSPAIPGGTVPPGTEPQVVVVTAPTVNGTVTGTTIGKVTPTGIQVDFANQTPQTFSAQSLSAPTQADLDAFISRNVPVPQGLTAQDIVNITAQLDATAKGQGIPKVVPTAARITGPDGLPSSTGIRGTEMAVNPRQFAREISTLRQGGSITIGTGSTAQVITRLPNESDAALTTRYINAVVKGEARAIRAAKGTTKGAVAPQGAEAGKVTSKGAAAPTDAKLEAETKTPQPEGDLTAQAKYVEKKLDMTAVEIHDAAVALVGPDILFTAEEAMGKTVKELDERAMIAKKAFDEEVGKPSLEDSKIVQKKIHALNREQKGRITGIDKSQVNKLQDISDGIDQKLAKDKRIMNDERVLFWDDLRDIVFKMAQDEGLKISDPEELRTAGHTNQTIIMQLYDDRYIPSVKDLTVRQAVLDEIHRIQDMQAGIGGAQPKNFTPSPFTEAQIRTELRKLNEDKVGKEVTVHGEKGIIRGTMKNGDLSVEIGGQFKAVNPKDVTGRSTRDQAIESLTTQKKAADEAKAAKVKAAADAKAAKEEAIAKAKADKEIAQELATKTKATVKEKALADKEIAKELSTKTKEQEKAARKKAIADQKAADLKAKADAKAAREAAKAPKPEGQKPKPPTMAEKKQQYTDKVSQETDAWIEKAIAEKQAYVDQGPKVFTQGEVGFKEMKMELEVLKEELARRKNDTAASDFLGEQAPPPPVRSGERKPIKISKKDTYALDLLEKLRASMKGSKNLRSTAGERGPGHTEMTVNPSSFPPWIPKGSRLASVVDATVAHIDNGTIPTKVAELNLYNKFESMVANRKAMKEVIAETELKVDPATLTEDGIQEPTDAELQAIEDGALKSKAKYAELRIPRQPKSLSVKGPRVPGGKGSGSGRNLTASAKREAAAASAERLNQLIADYDAKVKARLEAQAAENIRLLTTPPTPPTPPETPPATPPAEPSGGTKPVRLSQRTEQMGTEQGGTPQPGGVQTYKVKHNAEQEAIVKDIMRTDMARADRIAMGEETPPPGVLANAFYTEVSNLANQNNDWEKLYRLSYESPLAPEATLKGQEIQYLSNLDLGNPIKIARSITSAAEEAFKKRSRLSPDEAVKAGVKKAKQFIRKKPTKKDLKDFGLSNEC